MDDPTKLPFTEKLALLGLAQPSSRAFVAATLAGTFSYVTKMPACFYEEDGSLKPFRPLSPELNATDVHFFLVPLGAAVVAYLFT